jgi:hypothetical protein
VSRPGRMTGLALAAAVTIAGAGCASVPSRGHPDGLSRPAPQAALPGLATSFVTSGGTWAVAVLGGSAATDNNFWQLFVRPAGSSAWRLATPPGVASNGGLVAAGLGGQSLLAGFRPSQDLVFSPLASTGDDGTSWSSGVLDASLGNVTDAIAAAPSGGRLLALLSDGQIDQAGRDAATWSRLSSLRALAASPAGRRCAVTRLTAVALTAAGTPLAAGTCGKAGASGIFAYTGGSWRAAGPTPPATVAGQPLQVLRLTTTAAGETALLATTHRGSAPDLMAAWSPDGTHWTVSAPLSTPAGAAGTVLAAGFSATGGSWVLRPGGQAEMITPGGTGWQPLPRLPAHTALLAFAQPTTTSSASHAGSGVAGMEALATFGSKFSVSALTSSGTWRQVQAITVPVQYGSSS